ncbi:MAG: polysaccharide deacetylase family protein [Pseudolabrys sp.]|nr:polysaccharide deacetylase family protein [Pseudolabrys sp.]
MRRAIIRGGLEALYVTGLHRLLQPLVGGVGAILTLHHVRPPREDAFQPNRLLEVTPVFFERLLALLKRARVDVISLDEMHRRFIDGDYRRRFVCLTFDDGYKDVKRWAYPLLKQYEMPFALFIATSFPDRLGELWWLALEAAIARNARVGLLMNGKERFFDCATVRQKRAVYDAIYGYLRSLASEDELRRTVRDLCARCGLDLTAFCRDLCMDWREIADIAADPLCTIGTHTVNHKMLRKVADEAAVRAEMDMSRAVLEAALGFRPQHLAYPVGDASSAGPREFRIAAELGFKTAVTTRPGVLFRAHRNHLTALPRISVNGDYQRPRYAKVLMSGAATALWNGLRRVNVQ